jgi:hypothetical protein
MHTRNGSPFHQLCVFFRLAEGHLWLSYCGPGRVQPSCGFRGLKSGLRLTSGNTKIIFIYSRANDDCGRLGLESECSEFGGRVLCWGAQQGGRGFGSCLLDLFCYPHYQPIHHRLCYLDCRTYPYYHTRTYISTTAEIPHDGSCTIVFERCHRYC